MKKKLQFGTKTTAECSQAWAWYDTDEGPIGEEERLLKAALDAAAPLHRRRRRPPTGWILVQCGFSGWRPGLLLRCCLLLVSLVQP